MRPSSIVQSGMPSGEKWVRSDYNQNMLTLSKIGWWGAFGGPAQKGIKTYCKCFFYKLLVVFEQC
jgi:hypothetical protein